MKVLLLPLGTEGDVRPLVELGRKLSASGCLVSAAATPEFEPFFRAAGIPFTGAGISYMSWIAKHADLYDGNSRALVLMRDFLVEQFALQRPVLEKLIPGSDLVVASGLQFLGFLLSRSLGVEYRHLVHIPQFFPSDRYPPFGISSMNLPGPVNRLLWSVANLFINSVIKNYSRKFGFGTVTWFDLRDKLILSVDRILLDGLLPPQVPTMTYPMYDDDSELPEIVEKFLSADGRVVYVNFGSMPAAYLDTVCGVLAERKAFPEYRVLIRTGTDAGLPARGADGLPGSLFFKGALPHAKLFRKISCIVHHGGAGTVSEAARAGIPQIIIPHLGDQHFWAHITARLGLGPEPVLPSLIGKSLVPAVNAVLDGRFDCRCGELRDRILRERSGLNDYLSGLLSGTDGRIVFP